MYFQNSLKTQIGELKNRRPTFESISPKYFSNVLTTIKFTSLLTQLEFKYYKAENKVSI